MRKLLSMGIAALCLAGGAWAAEQSSVAVVDLEELVRLHPNTAADKKLLEQTLKEFNAQKDQLQARVEDARKAFDEAARGTDNPALGEKARKKAEEEAVVKRRAVMDSEREYGETVRSLQRQLTEQEVRMLRRTTDEIGKAVTGYARARGLTLVLQLPGEKLGGSSGVLYAHPSLNITTNIMPILGIRPAAPAADDDAPAATQDAP